MTANEKEIIKNFLDSNYFIARDEIMQFIYSLPTDPEPQPEPTPHKPTKISELGENDVIHTETESEYYRISILMHLAGKTWRSGKCYLENVYWKYYKQDNCFDTDGGYSQVKYYRGEDYNIIPSTQITGV